VKVLHVVVQLLKSKRFLSLSTLFKTIVSQKLMPEMCKEWSRGFGRAVVVLWLLGKFLSSARCCMGITQCCCVCAGVVLRGGGYGVSIPAVSVRGGTRVQVASASFAGPVAETRVASPSFAGPVAESAEGFRLACGARECFCGTSTHTWESSSSISVFLEVDDMQPLFGALIGTGFLCEQYDPRLFAARGHVYGFSREVFTDPQLRTSASSKGA
jgi:hypothetical protein